MFEPRLSQERDLESSRWISFPKLPFLSRMNADLKSILSSFSYLDQRIRRTVATFWSNTSDVNYLRGVRENRKIEELILMMVSVATKELQKEVRQLQEKKIEPDFDWKYELNVQVGQIVRILRDTLKSVSSTSPELLNKLEGYSSKLAATPTPALPPPPTPAAKPTPPPLNSSVSGMSQQRISRPPSVWNPIGPTSEMVMVQTVGTLFGKSAIELEGDVNAIKATCTEKVSGTLTRLYLCQFLADHCPFFPGCHD
jgi:hypothetical protein